RRRQRHADARLRHGRPGEHPDEGGGARVRPLRPGAGGPDHPAGQGRRGVGVHLRGRRRELRAAAAPRARPAARVLRRALLARLHPGPPRARRRGRDRHRVHRPADRQGPEPARGGGGQRPGQRARPRRPQRPAAGLPRRRPVRADRLPRADPRPGPRHRRHGPGAHPDHRRTTGLDHRGRRPEHHRGVLGGPQRRLPVRADPRGQPRAGRRAPGAGPRRGL
ncbi:MAG: (R)-citramalate synthase, partial [uncultured Friedmanniella sp.]